MPCYDSRNSQYSNEYYEQKETDLNKELRKSDLYISNIAKENSDLLCVIIKSCRFLDKAQLKQIFLYEDQQERKCSLYYWYIEYLERTILFDKEELDKKEDVDFAIKEIARLS